MNNEIQEAVAGPSNTFITNEYSTKRKRPRSTSESSSKSTSSCSSSSSSKHKSKKFRNSRRRHYKKRARKDKLNKDQIRDLNDQININRKTLNADDVISVITRDNFEQENNTFLNDLDIGTKLKEPAVPKTDCRYLNILKEIQFFNTPDWSDVRYAETQKKYNCSPGFVELEANDEIKCYDLIKHLSYTERSYASLTFAMLKQKEAIKSELCGFMTWIRDQEGLTFEAINQKVNDIFTSGEFSRISADLLQMICGHRAETIQMRRDSITNAIRDPLVKASLRKIPPSEVNLFNSKQFAVALEKAGGIRKAFWPASKSGGSYKSVNSNNVVSHGKWIIRPSQGQNSGLQIPSQGNYYCMHMPSQGDNLQHMRCPSQGSVPAYNYSQQSSSNTGKRGSFRPRGARQNQRNNSYKRGGYKRRSSPSGFNNKGNNY